MMRYRRRMNSGVALLIVFSLLSVSPRITMAAAGDTTRVSVASDGSQGNNNSFNSDMSADGRFVAFQSTANNLVTGDTNFTQDVFVHDRQTGETERVSVASDGTQGDDPSWDPSISADGRYVAFTAWSNNLVADDTNGQRDILVHDRQTGSTVRVSVASDGVEGNSLSIRASISADGRYVAFDSGATNLVSGDTNGEQDVFVHDRDVDGDGIFDEPGAIATSLVSVASDGTQGNDSSLNAVINADGRYVAFESLASTLVPGDTNGSVNPLFGYDIFVHDRQTGVTERVSVSSAGAQSDDRSNWSDMSADGRFVAFGSFATNLVADDVSFSDDVFVHDRQTGNTELVSIASDGTQGNFSSDTPAISPDGRYVGFHSDADNLVTGDTNNISDAFVHDRLSGETERVSVASDGTQGTGDDFDGSWVSGFSSDGRVVLIESDQTNLVVDDTNGSMDIFIHEREVIVTNAPPVVNAGPDATIDEGDTFSQSGSFTDADDTSGWTGTVDYGDGGGEQNLPLSGMSFDLSHVYADNGDYTVAVCVTDDEGGEGCDTVDITVTEQQVNQPPIVDLGDAVALADEGALFTRNGSFADPDSSSWTAIVDYGDGGGAMNLALAGMGFSLSHTYAEDGVYTIEVCVTDNESAEGCDSFLVTVTDAPANQPPTANAGGPYNVPEGASILLSGSGTDPENGPLTYAWDLDNNGDFGTDGQSATFSAADRDGPDSQTVVFQVCDAANQCDTDQTTVTITNVAPSVDAGDNQIVSVGEPVSLDPASFSDPGAADTHTATIDWGDGSAVENGTVNQAAQTVSGAHMFMASGGFTVEVCVSDDDDGEQCDSLLVSVLAGDAEGDLCANSLTGLLRMPDVECAYYEIALSVPENGSLTFCARHFSGVLRYSDSEDCAWYERRFDLPQDGPINVCINPLSFAVRYVSTPTGCAWYERHEVIGRIT